MISVYIMLTVFAKIVIVVGIYVNYLFHVKNHDRKWSQYTEKLLRNHL